MDNIDYITTTTVEKTIRLSVGQTVWVFPPYADVSYKCRYAGYLYDVDMMCANEVYTKDGAHIYWFDGSGLHDITGWHTEWVFDIADGYCCIVTMNRVRDGESEIIKTISSPCVPDSEIPFCDFDNILEEEMEAAECL